MKKNVIIATIFVLGWASLTWAEKLIEKIEFNDAAVLDVVQALSKQAGLDLVVSGDGAWAQNKRTTMQLRNISAAKAIEHVLATNGLLFEKSGHTLLVSMLAQDQSPTAYKQEVATVSLKYISASKAAEVLGKIMPSATFQTGVRANLLIIRARAADLKEITELLAVIDKLAPQILIESKVVEISLSDSKKLGINIGNGTFKFITSKETKRTSLMEDISATLNVLIGDGKANVLASPRIATLDNQEALINIGNRIPYAVPVTGSGSATQWTVEYLDAGVKLKITPQLGQEGEITTFIQPEVSSISEWRTTAAGEFPVISTRNASATVRVKNGETIVIGGLLSESNRENITRVPLLGYLPLLGLLFQNRSIEKEKTDIVFLITPHVI